MKQKYHSLLIFILALILSYFSFKPLISKGYFPMHDDTQPARIYVLSRELKQGIFPVRMVAGLGYNFGYPLFNFYAPLPYYLGSLFYLIGLDLILATKLMFLSGILLSLVFMFLLAKEIAGSLAAFTVSLFYLYAPYHAVNIYVRGSIGELFAYAFLPLFLWGLYRRKIFPAIIGLSAVILSHNIMGMLTIFFFLNFLIFSAFVKFIRKESQKYNFYLLTVLILSFSLSAFFIIPAILEKDFTNVNSLTNKGSIFSDHFVTLGQLWNSAWGFGGSAPGIEDGLSFKIGKLHLLAALAGLVSAVYLKMKKKLTGRSVIFFLIMLIIFLISVFMMLNFSSIVYSLVPFFTFIQYPWRFLNLTLLSLSILILPLFLLPPKINKISSPLITVFFVSLVIFLNAKYFQPQYLTNSEAQDYIADDNLVFKISRISDEYLPKEVAIPKTKEDIARTVLNQAAIEYKTIKDTATIKIIEIESKKNRELLTNIAFFPGWQYYVDGKRQKFRIEKGFMVLPVTPGGHRLEIKFSNNTVRFWSNTISFLSLILILYLALTKKLKLWPENTRLK